MGAETAPVEETVKAVPEVVTNVTAPLLPVVVIWPVKAVPAAVEPVVEDAVMVPPAEVTVRVKDQVPVLPKASESVPETT